MEQRLSLITLGVADLEKSKAFYEQGLGWTASPKSSENLVLFQIGGMVLALYAKEALAEDVGLPEGKGFGGMTLAYNTRTKEEVDQVLHQAKQAGAKVLKSAQDVFWGGYSGYFADLDGHPIEVAWNPFWSIDEAGEMCL
jgi:predicted lactoylglutathione lyase